MPPPACFVAMANHFRGVRAILAQNVRALRRELEWSQEKLAEGAELDRTYISEIERAIGNPSLETIARIASALQVTAADLLARRGPGSSKLPTFPYRRPKQ